MIFVAFLAAAAGLRAAEPILKDNEVLKYGLYMGPLRGGDATLSTRAVTYDGKKAYQMQLIANTTKAAQKIFFMSDTLTSILDAAATPLEFWKHCYEGDDIVKEKDTFSKNSDGTYAASLRKDYKNGRVKENDFTTTKPVYDMVSIVAMARSMQTSNLYAGKRIEFKLADAAEIHDETLIFSGRETMKVDGKKVQCLVFRLVEPKIEKGKSKDNDILTIFVSDDAKRTIVQLDIQLKFGSVKVKLL